jgi:hypothetical protein
MGKSPGSELMMLLIIILVVRLHVGFSLPKTPFPVTRRCSDSDTMSRGSLGGTNCSGLATASFLC